MAVHGIAFSPDGRRIATSGGPGETLKVWNADMLQELVAFDSPGFYHAAVEFSPDGNSILVKGGDSKIRIWQVPTLDDIEETIKDAGTLFPARGG